MDWFNALILGIVQGLAEYLPISSSGHLLICSDLLGIPTQGADNLEFSILVHVATVLSTIVILWREFVPLCVSFFTFRRDAHFYYVLKILLSCIPIMIVGLFFKPIIEELFDNNLIVVGICLIVTAMLLWLAHISSRRDAAFAARNGGRIAGHDISYRDAFVIGCAQAVAVLPGLSRSGTTIATGIMLGDRRDLIARFSFFMVIIPIIGEALLDAKDLLFPDAEKMVDTAASGDPVAFSTLSLIVGFLAAFIVGCLACKWMLSIVRKGRLYWFAIYCAIVGILCLIF